MEIRFTETGDIDTLIKIEKIVFPDTFNSKMGKYFLRRFFYAFMTLPGYKALTAVNGETPVGFMVGYPYEKRGSLNKFLTKVFIVSLLRNPFLIFRKVVFKKIVDNVRYFLFPKSKKENIKVLDIDYSKTFYMFLLAVIPEGRGSNLGRRFFLELQALAEQDGYRYFLGTSDVENKRGLYLWSSIGYEVIDNPDNPGVKYILKDVTKQN